MALELARQARLSGIAGRQGVDKIYVCASKTACAWRYIREPGAARERAGRAPTSISRARAALGLRPMQMLRHHLIPQCRANQLVLAPLASQAGWRGFDTNLVRLPAMKRSGEARRRRWFILR